MKIKKSNALKFSLFATSWAVMAVLVLQIFSIPVRAENLYNGAEYLKGSTIIPDGIPDILKNYFSNTSVAIQTETQHVVAKIENGKVADVSSTGNADFNVQTTDQAVKYISSAGSAAQMKNSFYTAYDAGAIRIQTPSFWDNLMASAALTFGRWFPT